MCVIIMCDRQGWEEEREDETIESVLLALPLFTTSQFLLERAVPGLQRELTRRHVRIGPNHLID